MTEEHWSEWKTHTPGPCPVPVGTYIEVIEEHKIAGERRGEFYVAPGYGIYGVENPGWLSRGIDSLGPDGRRHATVVICYRVRQYPDALEQLRQLAEDPHKMVEAPA